MIKAIAEMKKTHSRMTTILNELEVLEDGVGADGVAMRLEVRLSVRNGDEK